MNLYEERLATMTSLSLWFAESEGFKPPIPERGIPDFESSAFDHSANFPLSFAAAKVITFSDTTKFKWVKVAIRRLLIERKFCQTIF